MRKNAPVVVLGLLALLVIGGFFGWAFNAAGHRGPGWTGIAPILPYVIGGALTVGALAGVLMWLAFYSSRRGYDEPYDVDKPPRA